jgi:hypothetical protein
MIFADIITDRSHITVCGNLWPGAGQGAPPPDWVRFGGHPTHDHRTGAWCPACDYEAWLKDQPGQLEDA